MLDGIDQAVSAHKKEYTERNLEVIRRDYSWEKLVDEHEEYFTEGVEMQNVQKKICSLKILVERFL